MGEHQKPIYDTINLVYIKKLLLYPRTKGVKRGVSKVYLTLKYLEDNIYNVHLQSLH